MAITSIRPLRTSLIHAIALGAVLGACTAPEAPADSPYESPDAGPAEVVDCAADEAPMLLLGGGSSLTGFVNLADGDDMTGVLGPQGLYMVTPSIRSRGVYPGSAGRVGNRNDPQIVVEVFSGGALVGGSAREHMGMTPTPDGFERLGIFVPFEGLLSEYVGSQVTLRATLTDACDREVVDELNVVIRQ